MALIPQNVQTHSRRLAFAFKEVAKEAQLANGVAQALGQIKEKQHDAIVKQRKTCPTSYTLALPLQGSMRG